MKHVGRRFGAILAGGLTVLATSVIPAHASMMTVCDNNDPGLPILSVPPITVLGTYQVSVTVQGNNDTFVKIDQPGVAGGLDTLVGIDNEFLVGGGGGAVCVVAPVAGNHYVAVGKTSRPGLVGTGISLTVCTVNGQFDQNPTASCIALLGETGVFLNPTAPLFSCIVVNGVEQNPGCP